MFGVSGGGGGLQPAINKHTAKVKMGITLILPFILQSSPHALCKTRNYASYQSRAVGLRSRSRSMSGHLELVCCTTWPESRWNSPNISEVECNCERADQLQNSSRHNPVGAISPHSTIDRDGACGVIIGHGQAITDRADWRMVKERLARLRRHRWSSHRAYVGMGKWPEWMQKVVANVELV